MTADVLRRHTRRELEAMARRSHVTGWHDMNKEELVQALVRRNGKATPRPERTAVPSVNSRSNGNRTDASRSDTSRSDASRSDRGRRRPASAAASGATRKSKKKPSDARRSARRLAESRNGHAPQSGAPGTQIVRSSREPDDVRVERQDLIRDSLSVDTIDGRWLHVRWSLSASTRARARAAVGGEWRSAVPILRLYDVSGDERSGARVRSGDTTISLDEGCWYLRTADTNRRCLVELGFRTLAGKFVPLMHSPPPGLPQERGSWVDAAAETEGPGRASSNARAQSADRLIPKSVSAARRAADVAADTESAQPPNEQDDWRLHLQSELLLVGQTHPHAEVRARRKTVPVNADGRFSLRVPLENGRLVLPAEVVSPDGTAQRMVVVAVDLNIREMEPQVFDETAE